MNDVADRLTNRVQLTTDGLRSYLDAVYDAFGSDIDYAMLQKFTVLIPLALVAIARRWSRA